MTHYVSRRSLAIYGLHAPLLSSIYNVPGFYGTPGMLMLSLVLIVSVSLLAASLLVTLDRRGWVS